MAIEYADLTPERLDDLKDLLLPYWQRAWRAAATDAFFRWRFLERPTGRRSRPMTAAVPSPSSIPSSVAIASAPRLSVFVRPPTGTATRNTGHSSASS